MEYERVCFINLHIIFRPKPFSVGSTRCSYSCALLWQSVAVCVTHSPTSHSIHQNFFVTPLALHIQHLNCVSDQVDQCVLLQTFRLATCNSTLGGLPSGLGIVHYRQAYANIFLLRVIKIFT
jgi:hypothetical protein